MSMIPCLRLTQSSCAHLRFSKKQRLFSLQTSGVSPRVVSATAEGSRSCRRRTFVVSTPFRRSSSSAANHHHAPKHQHTTTEQKQSQKSAYSYYQRRQQDGLWNKFRHYVWPRTKKRAAQPQQQQQQQRNVNTAWYSVAVVVGALGSTYAAVPLYKVFCQTTGFGGTTQRVRIIPGSTTGTGTGTGIGGESTTHSSVGSTLVSLVDGVFASVAESFQSSSSSSTPTGSSSSSSSKSRLGGARVHTWTDEEAAARLASLKPVANADLLTVRFDTTVSDVMPWSFVPVQLDVKVVPGETALSFFRVTNHSDRAITGVATYNVHPAKVGLYFQKIQCFCFEEQRLLPGETVDMPVFFFIDPEIINDPQVSYVRSITLSYTFFQTDEEDDDDDDLDNDDENANNKTTQSK